jgi:hypothetical protein
MGNPLGNPLGINSHGWVFSHDPPSKYGCVKGFDAHPNKGILDQEILPDKGIIDNCAASDWLISASMRQRTTDRILLEGSVVPTHYPAIM